MSQFSSIDQAIASRIKGLREALGLSSEQLAETTGVPASVILGYESGANEVPVSFLYKLAKSTGVDLMALVTGSEAKLHQYSLVRRGEGLEVTRRKAYQYRSLAYRFNRPGMEPFLVTVPPKEPGEVTFNEHLGEEFIFMVQGRMEVTLGHEALVLGPEDSLYFSSSIPHAMRALDGKDAVFLDVII